MTTESIGLTIVKLKLSGIEAARGIAAVMVVFYHAARHLKADYGVLQWAGISQFGHAGVDFFSFFPALLFSLYTRRTSVTDQGCYHI